MRSPANTNHKDFKQRTNRRYYLHKCVRKQDYNLVTSKRTIYIPFDQTEFSKHVLELKNRFGYAIQTQLR